MYGERETKQGRTYVFTRTADTAAFAGAVQRTCNES